MQMYVALPPFCMGINVFFNMAYSVCCRVRSDGIFHVIIFCSSYVYTLKPNARGIDIRHFLLRVGITRDIDWHFRLSVFLSRCHSLFIHIRLLIITMTERIMYSERHAE